MSTLGFNSDDSAEDTWASFEEIELDGGYAHAKPEAGDQFVPGSCNQGWIPTGKRTDRSLSQKQAIAEGQRTKEAIQRESGWDLDSEGGSLLLEVPGGGDSSAADDDWGIRQNTPVGGDGAVLLGNSSKFQEDGGMGKRVPGGRGAEQGTKNRIPDGGGEVARMQGGGGDGRVCRDGSLGGKFASELRESSSSQGLAYASDCLDSMTGDLDSYLIGEGMDAGVWGEEGLEYSWDSINNLGNVNELFGGKLMSLEGGVGRRSRSPPSPTGGSALHQQMGRTRNVASVQQQQQDAEDMGWIQMDLAEDVLTVEGDKMGGLLGQDMGAQDGMMEEPSEWKMAERSPDMAAGDGEQREMDLGLDVDGGGELGMDAEWAYKEELMSEGEGNAQVVADPNQGRSGWPPAVHVPEEGLRPGLLQRDLGGRQAAQAMRRQQMLHKCTDEMVVGGQQRKSVQIPSPSPSSVVMNPAVQMPASVPTGGSSAAPGILMPPKRQGRQPFSPAVAAPGPPQFLPMPADCLAAGGSGPPPSSRSGAGRTAGGSSQPGPPRRQHLQQQHQHQQQLLRAQFQQQQQQLQLQQRQQQQLLNQQQRHQLTHPTYLPRAAGPVGISRTRTMPVPPQQQQQPVYFPYQAAPGMGAMGYPQAMPPPPGVMPAPRAGGVMWGPRPMTMMPQSPSPPPMWDLDSGGAMVGVPMGGGGDGMELGGGSSGEGPVAGSPVAVREGEEEDEDDSVEAKVLQQLDQTMRELDMGTQLCIRDALYRLARSARERRKSSDQSSSGASGCGEPPAAEGSSSATACGVGSQSTHANASEKLQPASAASEPSMESGVPPTASADMNAIDRSIVSLLFHLRKPRPVPGQMADPQLQAGAPMQQQVAMGGGPGQFMVNPMVPQPMGQAAFSGMGGPAPMVPVMGPGPMGSWGWQQQAGGPVPMGVGGGVPMMGPPAGVMGAMPMAVTNKPMGPPRPMMNRRSRVGGVGIGGVKGGGVPGPAGRGAWGGAGALAMGGYMASPQGRTGKGLPGHGTILSAGGPAVSSSSGSSKNGGSNKVGSSKGSNSGRSLTAKAQPAGSNAVVPSSSSGASESGMKRVMVGGLRGRVEGGGEAGGMQGLGVAVKQEEGGGAAPTGAVVPGEDYAGLDTEVSPNGDGEGVDSGATLPGFSSEGMQPLPPDR